MLWKHILIAFSTRSHFFAMKFVVFALSCCSMLNHVSLEDLPPPCFSEIYCYGRIIDSVMKNRIFNDSKTFVDLKLKNYPNETLKLFDEFMVKFNDKPTTDQLLEWVEENFDPTGSEMESWKPLDHKQNLQVYNRISDLKFKKFASDLNNIWIELSRKMKDEVKVSCRRINYRAIIADFLRSRTIPSCLQSFMFRTRLSSLAVDF